MCPKSNSSSRWVCNQADSTWLSRGEIRALGVTRWFHLLAPCLTRTDPEHCTILISPTNAPSVPCGPNVALVRASGFVQPATPDTRSSKGLFREIFSRHGLRQGESRFDLGDYPIERIVDQKGFVLFLHWAPYLFIILAHANLTTPYCVPIVLPRIFDDKFGPYAARKNRMIFARRLFVWQTSPDEKGRHTYAINKRPFLYTRTGFLSMLFSLGKL